jgi:hypothetical protein
MALKGEKLSKEHIAKIKIANEKNGTLFKKGHIPWHKGKPNLKIRREKNYNWKGGIYNNPNGYRYILFPEHPKANSKGYLAEHIVLIEKKIGRYLLKGEIVHHINKNKKDNRLCNLKLCKTRTEHNKIHKSNPKYLNTTKTSK